MRRHSPVIVARLAMAMATAATIACAAAGDPQNPGAPSPTVPAGWQTYSNTAYRFSVAYPDEYGLVPEIAPPPSGAVLRVRFQEKELLSSDFVDLEPARFTVEVFPLYPPTALASWLRLKDRLPRDATTRSVSLAGAREGLLVQQRQQLAPNQFYYFATAEYIYALTPLGANSPAILASFRLLRAGGAD
jgi:hypothetical protein